MKLADLGELARATSGNGVAPDWLRGPFWRKSITYYTGAVDLQTQVLWLQSLGLSADFRFPPDRVRRKGRSALDEFSFDDLLRLTANEGGLARTHWNGSNMTWFDWEAFQTHDKWAEPGELRRVGDCVIEFAPSAAYVEDWRVAPSAAGPLIGLRLVAETNLESGEVLHRGGGLIVCGDHAALVRGRASDLPPGRLTDTVGGMSREAAMRTILSFDASYATRTTEGAPFLVRLSTNPLREGEVLFSDDGFSGEAGRIYQRTTEGGVSIQREFTVDTFISHTEFPRSTSCSGEGVEWLNREANTLLACVEDPEARFAEVESQ
jgi:hypothetical protein